MSWKPSTFDDEVFRGETYDLPVQLWADAEKTVPFDTTSVTFEWQAWFAADEVVLKAGAGLTVTPGKEAHGSEPAEPASLVCEMTNTATEEIPGDVQTAEYVLWFTVEGKRRRLMVGTLTVAGP